MAQRKELHFQLIVLYLQCVAIVLWGFFLAVQEHYPQALMKQYAKDFFFCKALREEDHFICPATSSAISELMTARRLAIILLIKQFLGEGFPGLSLSQYVGAWQVPLLVHEALAALF